MSELSKQALAVENSTNFPNNSTGYITPELLRAFNSDMIDSTVNQIVYTADSSSWNSKISQLNAFTASQQPSFTALNAFTASQLTVNSGINAYTQSAKNSTTLLNVQTASFQSWTSSINQIQSNGTTLGNSTRFNLVGSGTFFSASLVQNVNGPIATLTFTSDNGKVNTSSFNDYTASAQAELDALSSSVAHAGYATTGSNTFQGSQIIVGNLTLGDENQRTADIYSNALTNYDVAINTNLQLAGNLVADGVITASLQQGYLLVGGNNGITTLLSTSSFITEEETGSLARLGANQVFTGNNTFTGNTVVSQSATFGTASFYGPVAITKGINSNVQLTGSLTVVGNGDIILGADPSNVYNGIGIFQNSGNYTYTQYGNNSSIFNFGVVDANTFAYSTELLATATPSQITFQDFSFGDYSYQTWLTLAANNGSNPAPVFNRGIVSSGSFNSVGTTRMTGSVTITGSVYQNVLPVTISSSTASIDLSKANYFTLTLAGTTNINVINPQPGITATLVITTDTAASASFSNNVKQPSGSFYAASPSGNVDIISFTAVNSSTVYAFPAQSFV